MTSFKFAAALLATAITLPAQAQSIRPDQESFRALYKELVETNTTLSSGSCTVAAQRMAERLKQAGFSESEITPFAVPEHPREGGLVAILPGSDKKLKPMLMLAHIDVVEARREDWTRDPFTLIEEDGFFFARGTLDDKAQAAVYTDAMIRLRQQKVVPKRTIKLALTCGEETTFDFNGAEWLTKNRPDLIAAEFGINEGGGGVLDASGKRVTLSMQVGEKAVQNFRIETTNPGGHSSRPVPSNAIYELAEALIAVRAYGFPIKFTDTTRAYFTQTAASVGGEMGAAITALLANPADDGADRTVSSNATYRSTLRTTCVATLLDGGHANNALPQRAGANVNCRIFPGETPESTRAALAGAINNPRVSVTLTPPIRPLAVPPPLDTKIMGPAVALAKKHFPGVPVVPVMSTGATDAIFFAAIGIPIYGVPGIFSEADFNGVHGLNERLRVRSLYEGRDYLFDLIKAYSSR